MNTEPDLIPRWQFALDAAKDIFTWTEPLTLAWLAERAAQASYIIEMGVYMGHSSKVMLAANRDMHLWAVDPFAVAGTEKVTRYFLREEIAAGRCEIIPKTSPEAADMLQHMKGKIDLVFVDDGHAEEDLIRDITAFYPLLRNGGVICGHDLDLNPDNNVARGVKRMLPRFFEPVPRVWMYVKP